MSVVAVSPRRTEVYRLTVNAAGWGARDPLPHRALRSAVGAAVRVVGFGGLAQDAECVVAELAANTRQHADGWCEVTLYADETGVLLAVRDRCDRVPVFPCGPPGPDAELAEGGRGLRIVAALASRAWVVPLASGKVVCAELASELAGGCGRVR